MASQDVNSVITILVIVFIYFMRHKTPFNVIWYVLRLFLLTLFAVLAANYAKGKLKEWWYEKKRENECNGISDLIPLINISRFRYLSYLES